MRAWLRSLFRPLDEPAGQGALSAWLYLRGLGLVFVIAFLSLWSQLLGLIGSSGMLPAAPFLRAVAKQVGASRFHLLPTLFWFGASDRALQLGCGLGVLCSLLLMFGVLELPALLFSWALYLSFVSIGREFLSFQWDALLLETALFSLPLLLSGMTLRSALGPRLRPVARAARALLYLLLFRFMFAAGWAKLRSGDASWRDLSALDYHFFTQPLPTLLGYYAHQLPSGLKKLATLLMLIVELGVPFLIFVPRFRRYAFVPLAGFQLIVAATGNYGFFNLLTIVLCIPLLPDEWLRRVLPRRLVPKLAAAPRGVISPSLVASLCVILGGLTLLQGALMFVRVRQLPKAAQRVLRATAPFEVVNHYGLFAVMTKERPEIILEGSRDGVTWTPYELRYKVGALERAPRWNAPHQPRLDWQLWFAALGDKDDHPFFSGLCIRLLQGSPAVLRLLERDPFAGQPPRFLRATRYQYFFTTLAEKRQLGAYFRRSDPELYLRPVSLE